MIELFYLFCSSVLDERADFGMKHAAIVYEY